MSFFLDIAVMYLLMYVFRSFVISYCLSFCTHAFLFLSRIGRSYVISLFLYVYIYICIYLVRYLCRYVCLGFFRWFVFVYFVRSLFL